MPPGPKPTVGRTVHVFDPRFNKSEQALAAIVTYTVPGSNEERLNATVFLPSGSLLPLTAVPKRGLHAEDHGAAVWDWPERG